MASLRRLQPALFPWAQALVVVAIQNGLLPRITSTWRSTSQQARLYRRFLQGLSRFPAAPPGYSSHEYGWAFDLVTEPFESLADLGDVWRFWGGFWAESDPIHFEGPGWPHKKPSSLVVASEEAASFLAGPSLEVYDPFAGRTSLKEVR